MLQHGISGIHVSECLCSVLSALNLHTTKTGYTKFHNDELQNWYSPPNTVTNDKFTEDGMGQMYSRYNNTCRQNISWQIWILNS